MYKRQVLGVFGPCLIVGLLIGNELAASPVVAEAEKDGLNALFTGLAGLLSGLGVWLAKTTYDKRNSKPTVVVKTSGLDPGEVAREALAAHEIACSERYDRIHQRIDKLAEDVSWMRGRMEKEK